MPVEHKEQHFLQTAFQYFVSARFAARAGFVPVCGNLFHHSVEMFLKAWLSRTFDNSGLKKLEHDLEKTWKKFKDDFPDENLDDFDETIALLQKFERIRYPTRIVDEGAIIVVEWSANPTGIPQVERPEPRYKLIVPDIDLLVERVLNICYRNTRAFTSGLNDYALDALTWNNSAAGWSDQVLREPLTTSLCDRLRTIFGK